jgi:predicted DsbA family dithiol-disulfide isomerase
MSQTTAGPLVVYADYVCPFCFLGYESLNRYQESRATPVAVEWHPYDLRSGQRDSDGEIDPSVDNGKDEEYYENARRNVERLAGDLLPVVNDGASRTAAVGDLLVCRRVA